MSNEAWATILVTIVFVGIPLAFTGWRYIDVRRAEQRQREFVNYHELIRWLVKGYPGDKGPMLDSQIAIIYELRNSRDYSEVSVRILEGLQQTWKGADNSERLAKEISLTLQKLKHD